MVMEMPIRVVLCPLPASCMGVPCLWIQDSHSWASVLGFCRVLPARRSSLFPKHFSGAVLCLPCGCTRVDILGDGQHAGWQAALGNKSFHLCPARQWVGRSFFLSKFVDSLARCTVGRDILSHQRKIRTDRRNLHERLHRAIVMHAENQSERLVVLWLQTGQGSVSAWMRT